MECSDDAGPDPQLIEQLKVQLSASLPGMRDDDLDSLATETAWELMLRVGAALSAGLSDSQLDEFEVLVDGGDDDRCTDWLTSNAPSYAVTVAKLRAKLIVEVVDFVATADASAVSGARFFAEIFPVTTELIENHFQVREMPYQRGTDCVQVFVPSTADRPALHIRCGLVGKPGNLIAITATAREADFSGDCKQEVITFACQWNRREWTPTAVVSVTEGTGRVRLRGEVASPINSFTTRAQIDGVIVRACAALSELFRTLRTDLSGRLE
jgi:hypothetical protein